MSRERAFLYLAIAGLLFIVACQHLGIRRDVDRLHDRLDEVCEWQTVQGNEYVNATYRVSQALEQKPYILVRQRGVVVTELPALRR